ncbi:MAG: hypothetical protein PUE66_01350 [Erysipelotrichaceae bacterium]|nr:hypothetical protein [Erysipelotrichaceae bacterium]
MIMWQYQNTDELYHHGVLGMKWGVRRYQNKDGSLTPKGKKRYSEDYNESRNIKRKGIKRMSNDDLRKVNNRDSLERTYKNNNSKVGKTIAIVGTTAGVIGSLNAILKNSPRVVANGKKAVNRIARSGKYIYLKGKRRFR